MKNDDFSNACKEGALFLEGFALIRTRTGPIWALIGLYGPQKSKKIGNKFPLVGLYKGPITLPEKTVWRISALVGSSTRHSQQGPAERGAGGGTIGGAQSET